MQRRKVLLAGLWVCAVQAAQAQKPAFFMVAASPEGDWQLWADVQQRILQLRQTSSGLQQAYTWPALADGMRAPSVRTPVLARYFAKRRSVVVFFGGCRELWEISLDPKAEPIFYGLVHDYRNAEAIGRPGYLGVRRTVLDAPLDDGYMDGYAPFVLGQGMDVQAQVLAIQLDIRRKVGIYKTRDEALAVLFRSSQPP